MIIPTVRLTRMPVGDLRIPTRSGPCLTKMYRIVNRNQSNMNKRKETDDATVGGETNRVPL